MPRTVTGMADNELLAVVPLYALVGVGVELDPEFGLGLDVGLDEEFEVNEI
jgi:hypothetical protein